MERWFTSEFKGANPARWKEIHGTICGTSDAGFPAAAGAIQNFDYLDRLPTIKIPTPVICGDDDPATPPDRNKLIASGKISRRALRGHRQGAPPALTSSGPSRSTGT